MTVAKVCDLVLPAWPVTEPYWFPKSHPRIFQVRCSPHMYSRPQLTQLMTYAPGETSPLVIWTMVEGYVILIAACVPTLHPVYEKLADLTRRLGKHLLPAVPRPPAIERPRRLNWHGRQVGPAKKETFWSAIMPSFGSDASAVKSDDGFSRVEGPLPRSLEDAANLAYPPGVIWKQDVKVGQRSRVRPRSRDSL